MEGRFFSSLLKWAGLCFQNIPWVYDVIEAARERQERQAQAEAVHTDFADLQISYEAIRKITETMARVGVSVTELAEALRNGLSALLGKVAEIWYSPGLSRRERRLKADRRRRTEAAFMVQIRRYERAGPYKRIFKPP